MKKINDIIKKILVIISFFIIITSSFGINQLPNCCPSGINEEVIWNYLLKQNPNVVDDYKIKLKNDFNFYKNNYENKINDCISNLEYQNSEYKIELDRHSKYTLGLKSGDIAVPNNEQYILNLNKEKNKKQIQVDYYLRNNYILKDGTDITKSYIKQLSKFNENYLSNKLFNYAEISKQIYDTCFKKSIISNCYYPCLRELEQKNNEIQIQIQNLYEQGKNEEASKLEYINDNTCLDKCSLNQNLLVNEFKKIDECSDTNMQEFKWIIPYLDRRKEVLKNCNALYKDTETNFKGIFKEPIGNSLDLEFKDNNSTNIKDVDETKNLTFSRIVLNLNGKDLTENMNYKLHFTLNYYGKDKQGNEMSMLSNKIPKLNFKYKLLKNQNLELKYKIDTQYLKKSGSLDGDIWINKANLLGLKKPLKVKVFISEYPENFKTFIIKPRKRLKIISLNKITNQNAWDNSWSTYELKVNNPENTYLKYTIMSNSKNAEIYLNGISHNKISTLTTKKQDIKFGWKAPKISKQARLDYAKHLESLTTNLAIKGGSEALGNKLEKMNKLYKPEMTSALINPIKNKEKFDNTMTGISTFNGGKQLFEALNGPKQGEDWSFYLTKNLVNGFINSEGYFGNYLEKSPIGLQYKLVSYGLVPIQEWYSMVDDMINISQSKIISQNEKIIVMVENKLGDIDTAEFNVTVDGFERILK